MKSAVVISNTNSLKTPRKSDVRWHSPSASPSPPSPASDNSSDCNQRNDSYTSQHSLYHDQDSGYDGFCPEKSIYSTGSSDTSSVMSSEGQDPNNVGYNRDLDIYSTRSRPRPRPSPIYEKHQDYSGQYGTLSPRAHIAQATVVNLVNKSSHQSPPPPDVPPPLPPRPVSSHRDHDKSDQTNQMSLPPHPPIPRSKPKSKIIMSGAISLPRRRDQFKEAARRRGSYHDAFTKENSEAQNSDLFIETEEKVKHYNLLFSKLISQSREPQDKSGAPPTVLFKFNKDINLTKSPLKSAQSSCCCNVRTEQFHLEA